MTTIRPVPPIGRPGDPSAVRSVRLGDVVATYVVDGVIMIRPRAFFPDIPADEWAAWPEVFSASGEMPMSAGGLMIERGGQRLLIDAGVGPLVSDFVYGSIDCGSLLDVLATLGRRPEDIDVVAFIHLHFDHAGWAFRTTSTTASPRHSRTPATCCRHRNGRPTRTILTMGTPRHRGTSSGRWPRPTPSSPMERRSFPGCARW